MNADTLSKLKDKYPEIRKIEDSKVFSVGIDEGENRLSLVEMCDEWYGHYLNKEACLQLSEFFKELSEFVN